MILIDEIKDEVKKLKTGEKELRSFACLVGSIFALLGIYLLWRQSVYGGIALGVGLLLFAGGRFAPARLRSIYKIWMTLALILGWIMTRVILGLAFYGILTPIGIIGRACGKKFLNRGFRDESVPSYWMARTKQKFEKSNFETQY
ncbi:MAG: SxtJ family membrane protein [Candidatus Omnitrophica bacterium]|nr:SxtJ family membrane protein [Candidatus Omnitrophota bacterium]